MTETDQRVEQRLAMAHLRPLRRCQWPSRCLSAATEELFTGTNDSYGVYCDRHARRALALFKGGGRV